MKNIMIFGDSYSTHKNVIPEGYKAFYCDGGREEGPAVTNMRMEDTWWHKFILYANYNLVRNDSWSGSTIGYTGYYNADCSQTSSFIYRYRKLKTNGFFEKNKVDTIIVFGGTNDSWCGALLGDMQFSDWEEKDLFKVLPAICYFAYTLKKDLPDVEIVFIVNTGLKEEIANCIEAVAKLYKFKSIRLENISKEDGHPTSKGMIEISEQIIKALA
ncbi:MAG: hypothetical protein IJA97_06545 [Clostridia bacterium]|nr:hypothetical protein [Clostridia bacterium]